jgi:hypothetical protein
MVGKRLLTLEWPFALFCRSTPAMNRNPVMPVAPVGSPCHGISVSGSLVGICNSSCECDSAITLG